MVYGFFADASSTAIEEVPSCELNRRLTKAEQKIIERCSFGLRGKKLFDKYGFPNHGNSKYEVRYWMPIPDFPEIDK